MDRILNIYKPTGISSYDVVRQVKKILPGEKIGHGGTLDPFAEGVLLILVGKTTKQMPQLLSLPKTYEALLRLGIATLSGDGTTAISQQRSVPAFDNGQLKRVAEKFTGNLQQVPPIYSAKKVNGRPAYRLARQGIAVQLEPVIVTIYSLNLTALDNENIWMNVTCAAGTYIRRLGEDIAQALGTVGYLAALKRTAIGDYRLEDAIKLVDLPNILIETRQEALI